MGLRQRPQPVIDAGVHIHNVAVLFNGIDSRQEAGALQTVAVEFIRRNIGGRDQRDAACKQRFH